MSNKKTKGKTKKSAGKPRETEANDVLPREEKVDSAGIDEITEENTLTEEDTAMSPEEELGKKLEELNNKYLRLYSDFDNFRKRSIKEKLELNNTASSDVISALLPVVDDFERGMKSMGESSEVPALKEGIKLIYDKLGSILRQKGLEPMKSIGEHFDTDFHEAISNIPAPSEDMKGKVIDEIEKGYTLKGKVLRYAKVVVGS